MNTEYLLIPADHETLKTFLEKKSLYFLVFETDGRPRLEQTAGRAPIHLKDGCPWGLAWVFFNSLSHTIPEADRLTALYAWAQGLVEEARHESA
jgi:hypothetical protein